MNNQDLSLGGGPVPGVVHSIRQDPSLGCLKRNQLLVGKATSASTEWLYKQIIFRTKLTAHVLFLLIRCIRDIFLLKQNGGCFLFHTH